MAAGHVVAVAEPRVGDDGDEQAILEGLTGTPENAPIPNRSTGSQ
jgi:hypothetical protein